MYQDMKRLDAMQDEVLEGLELALECGFDTRDGEAAYRLAMERFDRFCELKADQVYGPLAADIMTRDYVSRLDAQLIGLTSRIDILRTHLEVALLSGRASPDRLTQSLQRLTRQISIRFRREASLVPVYETWKQRQTAVWQAQELSRLRGRPVPV